MRMTSTDLENAAAFVHAAYISTCELNGWHVDERNRVPYDELAEEAKDLDRATARAAISAVSPQLELSAHKVAYNAVSEDVEGEMEAIDNGDKPNEGTYYDGLHRAQAIAAQKLVTAQSELSKRRETQETRLIDRQQGRHRTDGAADA